MIVSMAATCFMVGEGALLVECVQIAVEAGLEVKGIVSPDSRLRTEAKRLEIPFLERKPGWTRALRQEPFDYLFSIVNDAVLSTDTLRLPRRLAINYHDGPLPAYAGVHATFWSLVNGETTHGITWHVMQPEVDAGDVVRQIHFPVSSADTSASLNTRCFNVALESFRALTGDLILDRLSPQPQDLVCRSYYARHRRPDLRLDWRKSAVKLVALCRAAQFGFHPNPFGLPKTWFNRTVLLVQDAEVVPQAARCSPGTVEALTDDGVDVATGDGVLRLRSLLSPEGRPLIIGNLARQAELRPGCPLQSGADAETAGWQERANQASAHQAYWINQLANCQPTKLEMNDPPAFSNVSDDDFPYVDLALPFTGIEFALCTFLIHLGRVGEEAGAGIGLCTPATRRAAHESGGLLAACVAFRTDFDPTMTFTEACRHTGRELDRVARHDTFSRELFVTQPALHAFAQTFRLDGYPVEVHLQSEVIFAQPAASSGGLKLVCTDPGACRFYFNPAVWEKSRVAELARRWSLLATNLHREPDRSLAGVDALTSEERHRLLHSWNSATVPYPREAVIHGLFEEQAARRPDALALRCAGITMTYAALNRQANALARCLQKRGVAPDTPVGVCLERSPALVVSLLAILKAGGAYVPLDPAYPAPRIGALQTQAGISLIVTTSDLTDRLTETTAEHLRLDQTHDEVSHEQTHNLPSSARSDHLAYVLFTSGSTGVPKAVAVPHRGVVRLVTQPNYARFDESTVMLGLAPVAFDASTFEFWGSLTSGGQLILLPDARPSLESIKEAVREHQVTTTFVTSALFNVLVDSGIESMTSLREVTTGGDVVSPVHVARAYEQLPGCKFISAYGPTETTVYASFYPVPSGGVDMPSIPIGTPVNNTELYILDANHTLVPPGWPGELFIGGDGLARGYLGQPELTAERFVPHPFSADPGARLYKSGDRTRFLPDGRIEFLGRLDNQVKIRGFRIEPGEIETALCRHPEVREAVVIAREVVPGDKRLIAYLILAPGVGLDVSALRALLKDGLPEYMVPSAWIALDMIPLTPNGKVDKKRLPAPDAPTHATRSAGMLEHEKALHAIWTELLRVPDLGPDSSFFDAGGHSLLAIQMLTRVKQHFSIQLAITDVFAHPTLRQFSALLIGASKNEPSAPISPADPAEPVAPLSFAQQRLWVLHQLYDLGGTYNVPVILHCRGPLDLDALQRALDVLVQRQQSLRTTFGHAEGKPFQRVENPFAVPMNVKVLSPATHDQPEEVEQWFAQEAYVPFDLEACPLMRVRIARFGVGEHRILLLFHHLIFDGWSINVLANELGVLYRHTPAAEAAVLPSLPIQYTDYARWQAGGQNNAAWAASLEYWQNRLAGVPPLLSLPADKPRPPMPTFAGSEVRFVLPTQTWKAISQLRVTAETTPFMRLLAITVAWLGQRAGSQDVVVGMPIADRARPETAPLIGFLVNTLVLRVGDLYGLNFQELLVRVRERALEAYKHQDVPFEQLVEILNPPRTLAHAPLVQVVVDYNEAAPDVWRWGEVQVKEMPFVQHRAKFDLHVSFRQTGGEIEGVFNYNSDLFERERVVGWTEELIHLANSLAREPGKPLVSVQCCLPTNGSVVSHPVTRTGQTADRPDAAPVEMDADSDAAVVVLRTLWARLLGGGISWEDHFFERGGHSLLAFQLVAELHRQTGRRLPIAEVFANPTLRQLAARLAHQAPERWSHPLVILQPGSHGQPLFFVHDVTGNVDYARSLVPYLRSEIPVCGFEFSGGFRDDSPSATLEDLAARYIRELIVHQPEGPYALAGYSLGGAVAFEMARQLRLSGREVALLVMLDAYPLTPPHTSRHHLLLRHLLRHGWKFWWPIVRRPTVLGAIARKSLPRLFRYLDARTRFQDQARAASWERQVGAELAAIDAIKPLLERLISAYSRYVFRPEDVRIIFVRASGDLMFTHLAKELEPYDFGWNQYALGGVEVHGVPSRHAALFKDKATLAQIGKLLTQRMFVR